MKQPVRMRSGYRRRAVPLALLGLAFLFSGLGLGICVNPWYLFLFLGMYPPAVLVLGLGRHYEEKLPEVEEGED